MVSSAAKRIGLNIRHWRRIRAVSQESLGGALAAPMKQQVVSKIERGKKEPTATQLLLIAHQLDVDVRLLLAGV